VAGAGEFGRAAREEDHTVLVVHERSGECLCMRSLHCRYDGLRMRPLSHIGRTHRYDGLRMRPLSTSGDRTCVLHG